MTNIPKKLPKRLKGLRWDEWEAFLDLMDKINELIDYLQAKENKSYKAASSVCCDSSFRLEGDTKEGTMFHVCNNCNKACDIKLTEKKVEASKEYKNVCNGLHYHSFWRYSDKCMGCGKTLDEIEEASKCTCEVVPGLGILTNYSCPEHGYQHPFPEESNKGERRIVCKDCRKRDAICSTHLCMVCLNKKMDNPREASKGDNPLFNDQKLNECANILANNDMDKIKRASKGECRKCGCEYPIHKGDCPELYPPEHEEDEVEKIINPFIEKWLPDSYPHLVDTDENDGQRLRDKIRDNFVSKEKIKNIATQVGMRSSAKIVQLKTLNRIKIEKIIYDKILESLGLGD